MPVKKIASRATKPAQKNLNQSEAINAIVTLMEKKHKCDKIWHWVMGILVFLVVIFFYFGNIVTYYINAWFYQFINK
ncbi:hypothetical protein KKD62_01000 [Patescibacteria group bacterium]|nr:hypothetical protein [Patescibacteria group bacterium]MBU1931254.1 hypothetical protein [Patescibacteria group bacterium]